MHIARSTLLVLLFALPLLSHGQENCLWLNAATAGGVLGGPVTLAVSHPNPHPMDGQPANVTSAYGPTSANATSTNYAGNAVDDADCTYDRQPATAGGMHVSVRTMPDSQKAFASYVAWCGARGTPLKAIGNEAVTCELKGKSGHLSEEVVGRIRDRIFQIDLSVNDRSLTSEALHEKARATAEIIAGNLF